MIHSLRYLTPFGWFVFSCLLFWILLIGACNVWASPYLVCDPQAGITFYRITLDPYIPWAAWLPAQADGSLKTDLAGIPIGVHNIAVAACTNDPLWGETCSSPVPFSFVRPISPSGKVQNIRIVK